MARFILADCPWLVSEVSAVNHRRGDAFGGQSRCVPSSTILYVFLKLLAFLTDFQEQNTNISRCRAGLPAGIVWLK